MRFKSIVAGTGSLVVAALMFGALPSTGFALTSANLLLNADASLGTGIDPGIVTDWTVGGTSNPGRDSGGTFESSATFIPPVTTFAFYGGHGASGSLTQVVDLLGSGTGLTATDIDAGTDSFNVSFDEQSLNQGPTSDEAEVLITFQDASHGALSGGYNSGQISNTNGTWLLVQSASPVVIPVDARFMTYEMLFTLEQGGDLDAFIASPGVTTSTTPGSTGPTSVPLPSAVWTAALTLLGIGSISILRRKFAAI